MSDGNVEEAEVDFAETIVRLEAEANERKGRLREMRERMQREGKFSAFPKMLQTVF